MKALKFGLVGIGLIFFLILLPNTASARTRFYLSIGGHRSPSFHPSFHPYYRRHKDYYGWYRYPGYYRSFRYSRPRVRTFVFNYGYRYPYREPEYLIIDPPPLVIPQLVIERPPLVIEKETVIVQPKKYVQEHSELFKRLREKKSQLLNQLKSEDKNEREEAISELAGFSFDDRVREALEKILLSDPDPELRKEVAESLGKVKNEKALPALEKARVEDSNMQVRKEADQAIKKINPGPNPDHQS